MKMRGRKKRGSSSVLGGERASRGTAGHGIICVVQTHIEWLCLGSARGMYMCVG